MALPRLFIITGAVAAGKSTIAVSLARRLEQSVHLRGDVFRKMIVNGAAAIDPELSHEASRQLALRQRLACEVAEGYIEAAFFVVYQDVLVDPLLQEVAGRLRHLSPAIVVLVPRPEILARRYQAWGKTGYGEHFPPTALASALEHGTPRLGLWIDNSDMSVNEAVDRILGEFGRGRTLRHACQMWVPTKRLYRRGWLGSRIPVPGLLSMREPGWSRHLGSALLLVRSTGPGPTVIGARTGRCRGFNRAGAASRGRLLCRSD